MRAFDTDPQLAPREEILLRAARTRVEYASIYRIRSLIEETDLLAEVVAAAADQGMAPLLCHHLINIAAEQLPPLWREQLRQEFRLNSRRNLVLTAELFRLVEAFAGAGIDATPHKGPVLAAMAYGDIALRQFADLDFVLHSADIVRSHAVLRDLGYRSEIPWSGVPDTRRIPGHYAYSSGSGHIHVELHTPATLRYFPKRVVLDRLLANRQSITVLGRRILSFAAEDTMALLCVHGAKHRWDQLSWITDISELAQSRDDFAWSRCEQTAKDLGALRMLHLGLATAQRMLDTPLPDEMVGRIERDHFVKTFSSHARREFAMAQRKPSGPLKRFQMRVQMGGGGYRGARYATRLVIAPTEEDWTRSNLPRGLRALYAVLRPLRLWRQGREPVARQDAPEVETIQFSQALLAQIVEVAGVSSAASVLDLTSARGQLAIQAALLHGAAATAYFRSAAEVAQAKINARAAGVQNLVRMLEGAPEAADLSACSVIFAGSRPRAGCATASACNQHCAPGTRVLWWEQPAPALSCSEPLEGKPFTYYLWTKPVTTLKQTATSQFPETGSQVNSIPIMAGVPLQTPGTLRKRS
jgi:hypothetical protein